MKKIVLSEADSMSTSQSTNRNAPPIRLDDLGTEILFVVRDKDGPKQYDSLKDYLVFYSFFKRMSIEGEIMEFVEGDDCVPEEIAVTQRTSGIMTQFDEEDLSKLSKDKAICFNTKENFKVGKQPGELNQITFEVRRCDDPQV